MDLQNQELDIRVYEKFVGNKVYVGDVDSRVLTIEVMDDKGIKQKDSSVLLNVLFIRTADWGQQMITLSQDADGYYKTVIPYAFFQLKGKLICGFQLEKSGKKKGVGVREYSIFDTGFNDTITQLPPLPGGADLASKVTAILNQFTEKQAELDNYYLTAKSTMDKLQADTNEAVIKLKTDATNQVDSLIESRTKSLDTLITTKRGELTTLLSDLQAKVDSGVIKLENALDRKYLDDTVNGKATELTNNFTKAIGDIKIGGRNLILNSERTVTNSDFILAGYQYSDVSKLEQGEAYTITVEGELAPGQTGWYFNIAPKNPGVFPLICDNFKKVAPNRWIGIGKMPVLSEGQTFRNESFLYSLPRGSGKPATVHRIKVEKGTVPTDWTPAPEDMVSISNLLPEILKIEQLKPPETVTNPTGGYTKYPTGIIKQWKTINVECSPTKMTPKNIPFGTWQIPMVSMMGIPKIYVSKNTTRSTNYWNHDGVTLTDGGVLSVWSDQANAVMTFMVEVEGYWKS